MTIREVKPVVTSLQEANAKSAVFCTIKYVHHYLVLCGPNGSATAWSNLKAAETSWKRNYTRLAQRFNTNALEQHFKFFQPRLHLVTDVDAFEAAICPEPRRAVNAEYIVGNCLGLTCNNESAAKFHEQGHEPRINFAVVERLAKAPRV